MNPGPPVNYHISQSQLTAEQFRRFMALAARQGRRQLALRAARYMIDELGYDPLHFGESREKLIHLQLEMRIAFAPPLYVEFAVHEVLRQVFIRRFGLCGRLVHSPIARRSDRLPSEVSPCPHWPAPSAPTSRRWRKPKPSTTSPRPRRRSSRTSKPPTRTT